MKKPTLLLIFFSFFFSQSIEAQSPEILWSFNMLGVSSGSGATTDIDRDGLLISAYSSNHEVAVTEFAAEYYFIDIHTAMEVAHRAFLNVSC